MINVLRMLHEHQSWCPLWGGIGYETAVMIGLIVITTLPRPWIFCYAAEPFALSLFATFSHTIEMWWILLNEMPWRTKHSNVLCFWPLQHLCKLFVKDSYRGSIKMLFTTSVTCEHLQGWPFKHCNTGYLKSVLLGVCRVCFVKYASVLANL